jgi:mannose-6-phosphate isomerase-like protein (cupin superfamily)
LPVGKDNSSRKAALVDLKGPQNHWIVGTPPAIRKSSPLYSKWVQMAYTNSKDSVQEDERLHSHSKSEEYYLVIKGALVVRVDKSDVRVGPMQLLKVPKKVPHKVTRQEPPLTCFTIRVPSALPSEKTIIEE